MSYLVPAILIGGIGGLAYLATRKQMPSLVPDKLLPKVSSVESPDLVHASGVSDDDMVTVTLPNGEEWQVARQMIGPVGIGEAVEIAKSKGFQLPTSALVDAIFNAADLKIDPLVRASDGTPRTMSSPAVFASQKQRIDDAIAGRPFNLLVGTHKDVVILPSGKPGLYGWNVQDGNAFTKRTGVPTHAVRGASGAKVEGGRVVQQEFGGHGLDWKDYSQGVRLVRKVERSA